MDKAAIMNLARQVGLDVTEDKLDEKLSGIMGKSDRELMSDILKIKQQIKQNPEKWAQYLAALKMLGPMLDNNQRKKLQQFIELLEK